MVESIVMLAIQLVVLGVVAWGVWYITTAVPIPDPLGRVIRVVVMVICVAAAVLILLRWAGLGGVAGI
jgi:hypothetical protein